DPLVTGVQTCALPICPPAVDTSQAAQTAERRQTIDDALARLPRLDIGYRIPSTLSPDDDTIDVLALVLSGGRASRFNEIIVRQKIGRASCREKCRAGG